MSFHFCTVAYLNWKLRFLTVNFVLLIGSLRDFSKCLCQEEKHSFEIVVNALWAGWVVTLVDFDYFPKEHFHLISQFCFVLPIFSRDPISLMLFAAVRVQFHVFVHPLQLLLIVICSALLSKHSMLLRWCALYRRTVSETSSSAYLNTLQLFLFLDKSNGSFSTVRSTTTSWTNHYGQSLFLFHEQGHNYQWSDTNRIPQFAMCRCSRESLRPQKTIWEEQIKLKLYLYRYILTIMNCSVIAQSACHGTKFQSALFSLYIRWWSTVHVQYVYE